MDRIIGGFGCAYHWHGHWFNDDFGFYYFHGSSPPFHRRAAGGYCWCALLWHQPRCFSLPGKADQPRHHFPFVKPLQSPFLPGFGTIGTGKPEPPEKRRFTAAHCGRHPESGTILCPSDGTTCCGCFQWPANVRFTLVFFDGICTCFSTLLPVGRHSCPSSKP